MNVGRMMTAATMANALTREAQRIQSFYATVSLAGSATTAKEVNTYKQFCRDVQIWHSLFPAEMPG